MLGFGVVGEGHANERAAVPTATPKQLTDAREPVDSPIDERSLQIDLVRLDQAVPVAGCIGSGNPLYVDITPIRGGDGTAKDSIS